MSKKLTIQDLIAQKEKLLNKKLKKEVLFIKSFDGEITITAPSSSLILEAQDLGEDDPTRADVYMVYQCMVEPNLKDQKLQEAFDCVEPMDVVEEIFLPGEIASIASKIMGLGGFGDSVTIKN